MSDIYLELKCNDSKVDSRNIDLQKDLEKEMKTIDYILEKQLLDNEIIKNKEENQKINDCKTNELHPISPIEFLNEIPSYLVSDLSRNKSGSTISNSLSIAALNKMAESKKLLSELSAFDEVMLSQCKTLRTIANGLGPVENLNQARGKCTSETNTGIGTLHRNVNCHAVSSATEGLPKGYLNGDYGRYTTKSSNFCNRNTNGETDEEEHNKKPTDYWQQTAVNRCKAKTNIVPQQQVNVESAGDYGDSAVIARAAGALQSKGYDDSGDNDRYATESSFNQDQEYEEETYDEEGCYSSYADEYREPTYTADDHRLQINYPVKRGHPVNVVTESTTTRFFGNDRLSFSQSSIEEDIMSRHEFIVYDDDEDDYYSQE